MCCLLLQVRPSMCTTCAFMFFRSVLQCSCARVAGLNHGTHHPQTCSIRLPFCVCPSSMDGGDAAFLQTVLGLGCEVHRFDPSNSNASGGHLGNSLPSNHGNGGTASQHKMWLEWRVLRKRKHKTRGSMGGVSQTLADIMAALGHHIVRHTHTQTCTNVEKLSQTSIPQSLFTPAYPESSLTCMLP